MLLNFALDRYLFNKRNLSEVNNVIYINDDAFISKSLFKVALMELYGYLKGLFLLIKRDADEDWV